MRADAHYVDQLSSRRGDKAAERAQVERQESRERVEKLLSQLSEELATIETAVAPLAGDTSRLSRRVNVDLIKSQVWRSSWALRAHAILDGSHRLQVRPRPIGFLLGHVRAGWAAECKLESITLQVQVSDWNAVVPVDEQAFVAGVNGAIIATLGLIGQADGATLAVTAAIANGQIRSVDVSQSEVLVSPNVSGRFFDAAWSERPGGWLSGFAAATARAVAQQHGGDAVCLVGEAVGSTVRLTLGKA
jgi:hypothetical protein